MPTPKPHLLSLPPELLQSIYLHSLSPHFPLASPLLARVLSTNQIYQLTFLHAFWNSTPLLFGGATTQETYRYEPGPHVRGLFHPLSVPMPVSGVEGGDSRARIELQEMVLRCRWCGFSNAKRWLEEIMQAVMKDLLRTLDLPLSQDDQMHLSYFIARLPASHSVFKPMTLDKGSSINLYCLRPFATALLTTYRGPDTRFDQDSSPNLIVAPTAFLVLPPHVLTGNPEWSQEKIDELKMLSSNVNLRTVHYQFEAFYQGMSNAIVHGHYDALLTLLWLATRLVEFSDTASNDANPFKPPAELFRLVARRDLHAFTASSDELSGAGVGRCEVEISIRLFTLLLRAHAESMPQNDAEIEAWANHLRTWHYSTGTEVAFAKWVSDWSSKERCSEFIYERYGVGRGQERKVRRPVFQAGSISRKRREEEMARRFNEIFGGRVMRFAEEVERWG